MRRSPSMPHLGVIGVNDSYHERIMIDNDLDNHGKKYFHQAIVLVANKHSPLWYRMLLKQIIATLDNLGTSKYSHSA